MNSAIAKTRTAFENWPWIEDIQRTFPVLCAYVPCGFAFGILLSQTGVSWFWAPVMSIIVYTGAAQFALVGLIAGGADLVTIASSVLILNSRHFFYGLSLLDRYRTFSGWRKWVMVHLLTDETYSLISTDPEMSADNMFRTSFLNHSYWVLGSLAGSLFAATGGSNLPGVEFIMTCLFAILAYEQLRARKHIGYFCLAWCLALFSLYVVPNYLLLVAMSLSTALLLTRGRMKSWSL